jgi:hypothetical protein
MLWWRSDNQGTFECTMYRVQSDIRQAEIAQVCQQLLVNTKSEREGGYFKDADRNRSPWQIRRPEKQGKFRFVIRKQDRTGRQGQGSSGDVIGSARNPSREKCKLHGRRIYRHILFPVWQFVIWGSTVGLVLTLTVIRLCKEGIVRVKIKLFVILSTS